MYIRGNQNPSAKSRKKTNLIRVFEKQKQFLIKDIKHVKDLHKFLKDLNLNKEITSYDIKAIKSILKTSPKGNNKFEQYLARNFILTFLTKHKSLTIKDTSTINRLLKETQKDIDFYLRSPIKNIFGSYSNREKKLQKLDSIADLKIYTLEDVSIIKDYREGYSIDEILNNKHISYHQHPNIFYKKEVDPLSDQGSTSNESKNDSTNTKTKQINDMLERSKQAKQKYQEIKDSDGYTSGESLSVDSNSSSYGFQCPEQYSIQQKNTPKKCNLFVKKNNRLIKQFTISETSEGFNLKSWYLKRKHQNSPLGKGAYGQYHGDTFLNLTKKELEYLIFLSDKKLDKLDNNLKNPFYRPSNDLESSLISKAYARKKPNSDINPQNFKQDISASSLYNKFGKNYTLTNFSQLLKANNIIEVKEQVGKKNQKYSDSKIFGLAPRAPLDLFSYQKKNTVSFEKLFSDLSKSFYLLEKLDIAHTDIKADNILYHDGKFKLTDFGLCTSTGSSLNSRPHPVKNFHLAPEYFYSKQIYCKGDVWSFGLLLLQNSLPDEFNYQFIENLTDLLKLCCSPNKDDLKVAQTKWNNYVDSTLQNLTSISKKYKPILKNMLNPDVNQRKTMSTIFKDNPWLRKRFYKL